MSSYKLPFKIALSALIFFHWFCITAWLLPNPSAIKTHFLDLRVPFFHSHQIVESYLHYTSTHQDWTMFAPNPLQKNMYVGSTVHFRDGSSREFSLPRLSLMRFGEAWINKRYRKYQYTLIDEKRPGYRIGLARYIAKKMNTNPDNPPTRVVLNRFDSHIPPHAPGGTEEVEVPWVDYTRLLRQHAHYISNEMMDYTVRPKDLL